MPEQKIVADSNNRFRSELPLDSIQAGNAYGTVVSRRRVREGFDLWEDVPIICGHGGSMWLCSCCADAILQGIPCATHIKKAKLVVQTLGTCVRTSWSAEEISAFRDLGLPSPIKGL